MKCSIMKASAALMVCLIATMVFPSGGLATDWPQVDTKTAAGITYVNGGFGIEEREVMPGAYPLKIIFATVDGHYLSNVDIAIFDRSGGTVFEVNAGDGPWLLVDLEPGSYRLEAVHNGHKKTVSSLTVPSRGTRNLLISWKISEVDMGLEE